MIKLPNKIKKGLKIFGITIGMILSVATVEASITSNLPKSKISDEFPKSYQSYIEKLKEIYPNSTFKAVYTGLKWDTVLKHECYEVNKRISTIPDSYPNTWKMNGKNTYIDGYFVAASKCAVAYVLDPRNSLYKEYVFQFEGLSYNPDITTTMIEKVIQASPMVGQYERKYKKSGQWIDMEESYAEIISRVGKELGVSGVYIASRMMQETSGDIVNNGSINGSSSTYPGVYNFFNIGATPNADGTGAITNGLKKAKSLGWTTPYLSIKGGTDIIKSSYIKYGQDTVYFQKFDVNNPYGNASALMAYQYQTNIKAPMSESLISYRAYNKLGMLEDTSFTFYIPVYENMPEDPTPYPAGDSAKFESDNTKVYLDDGIKNGTDVFNIRSSANSELDNIIYTLKEEKEGSENRTLMMRTKVGNGYDWDYVEFTVGDECIKGYVWKDYVNEYNYTKVTEVTLDKTEITLELDESCELVATISPDNAKFKSVEWSIDNEEIVVVEDGKLVAKKVGEATVTVTTVDQEKTASCKVTVIDKIQEITLDKEEYIIEIGETATPQITLKNIAEYTVEIENTEIATILDGVITASAIGETFLKVYGVDTEIVKEAKVTVIDKKPEEEIGPSYTLNETLKLNEGVVTGITPETLVNDVVSKIELIKLTVKVVDSSNNLLNDEDKVGTDSKIVLYSNEEIFSEFVIVIRGDVTGDGVINSADLLRIVKYLKQTSNLNEQAADVTMDGQVNSADLLKIVKYLKQTAEINFD